MYGADLSASAAGLWLSVGSWFQDSAGVASCLSIGCLPFRASRVSGIPEAPNWFTDVTVLNCIIWVYSPGLGLSS